MQRESKKAKLNPLPVDGIAASKVRLPRAELVDWVVGKAREGRYVIVRSPPGTGKTSLLRLVQDCVTEESGLVYRISGIAQSNSKELFEDLEAELGEPRRNLLKQTTDDIWIFVDDAQLSFSPEYDSFWNFLMKRLADVENSNVKVVIAATYDLASQGSTPIWFGNYPHAPDLRLSDSESMTLYNDNIDQLYGYGFEQWESFSDSLLRLANGHPGVIISGINMLIRLYHKLQKRLTEEDVLRGLREDFGELNRCFPVRELLSQAQLNAVSSAVIQNEGAITDDWTDNPVLKDLARAGILREPEGFSCLAAQKQYYKSVYNRPETSPASLDELIMSSVRSLSALQLRGAKESEDGFPKEAAFQHLFSEAMTRLLAPQNNVCPELNTFVQNDDGTWDSGELDFFINADLKWALELLRNGDKIGEHVARFDPQNGKYRLVPCSQFIVVDCRGPKGRSGVQAQKERCTLYFSEDFTKVVVKMRLQKEVTITLKP